MLLINNTESENHSLNYIVNDVINIYLRVCVWTALLLILLATFNASSIINRFTRVAEELFGMLITVLFIQEAIKVSMYDISTQEGLNKMDSRLKK